MMVNFALRGTLTLSRAGVKIFGVNYGSIEAVEARITLDKIIF